MRTGAASAAIAVRARRHNENDITMTIAGLWRYGDWHHVATGCIALVETEDGNVKVSTSEKSQFMYKFHTNQNIHSATVQQSASYDKQQLIMFVKQALIISFTVASTITAEFHLPMQNYDNYVTSKITNSWF